MVIGTVGLRSLSSWLAGASDQIGREINPHTMSVEEFRRRQQKEDHFLPNVLKSPKLFIVGNEPVKQWADNGWIASHVASPEAIAKLRTGVAASLRTQP